MTVEEMIRKLQAFPADMPVKIATVIVEDVANVLQDGEDYVKIVA